MKENHIKSEFSSTWIEDGVIYQVINPHLNAFNLHIAKELVADRLKACEPRDGVLFPVILVFSNMVSMDKETRQYYALEEPFRSLSGIAIILDNYVARLLCNLVYKINKPPIPMAFFNDKSKALKWLDQYMLHNMN
jgi:hypothetical protein